jgi:hypothetical protein
MWGQFQEGIAERVAWRKRWNEELHQANLESPLPDDFIEYVKGRKILPVATELPVGELHPISVTLFGIVTGA